MQKLIGAAAATLAASVVLLGTLAAQQSTTSTAKPAGAKTTKTSTSTTTKAHTATTAKSAQPLTLTTEKDKASYAIGMNLGKSMRTDGADLDPDIVARGMKDGFSNGKVLMTDQEAQAALMAFRTTMTKKKEEEAQRLSETNLKSGEAFLAANKSKEGVVTLPSGLQYKILKQGDGPKPTANDMVVTNYRGTLINGTEFDSSYKRGAPATFPITGVIKGWTEALQLMPVGSKWELYIPPSLAYGERSPGPEIGPNSTLVFDVELLSIKEKDKQPETKEPQQEEKKQ